MAEILWALNENGRRCMPSIMVRVRIFRAEGPLNLQYCDNIRFRNGVPCLSSSDPKPWPSSGKLRGMQQPLARISIALPHLSLVC